MEKGVSDLLRMENIEEYLDFVDEDSPKSYLNKEGEYLLIEIDNHSRTINKHIETEINRLKVEGHIAPKDVIRTMFMLTPKDQPAKTPLPISLRRSSPAKEQNKATPTHRRAEDDLLANSHSN